MRNSVKTFEPTDLPRAAVNAWSTTVVKPSDLEQVFAQFVDPVHRFLYSRVGNREDAEDLTSEVFVKAARLLDGKRSEASIATWLFTVARTVLADHWRKYYRNGDTVELDERRLASLPPETARTGPSEANAELLEQTMRGLSDRYRRVLELRFLLGYTIQETATEMGISSDNVKVVQHRALAQAVSIAESQDQSVPARPYVNRPDVRSTVRFRRASA
jgi:RNA polymerase sigma factor (sigma-70 family)